MKISFIIPAYNEEENIGKVIQAIHHQMKKVNLQYEIIVLDNESTDKTVEEAEKEDIDLIYKINRNHKIGALRNYGAKKADGNIFAFIDADVVLRDGWAERLVIDQDKILNDHLVTGAVYGIDDKTSTWVVETWFRPIINQPKSYINGGNLIVSKEDFKRINGFDEMLETGEDVDFCNHLRASGCSIVLNPLYNTAHLGYPRTVKEFYKRERWHGTGNWQKPFGSKTSLTLVLLWVLLTVSLIAIVKTLVPLILTLLFFLILTLAMSLRRGSGLRGWWLACVWFVARMSSLFHK